MVSIFPLILFSFLNYIFRSILHDRKVFNNPQQFQPERYLKDGKLHSDARDPDCAVFGFGRRSVNAIYSTCTLINSSPVYVLEDTWATARYTRLYPVFSWYITSNHQWTTREIRLIWNLSLPPVYWRKYVQSSMLVTVSWNCFDSTGTLFPSNVLSNLDRLRPKRWFVILSIRKANALNIPELKKVYEPPLLYWY